MAEMVLPGVYVTVKDEGLITAGAVSVGNIGIVGTAVKGELNNISILTGYTEAFALFGDESGTASSSVTPTLLKSIELLFNNGASKVYAVRVADNTADAYKAGLALLEKEIVNIVLLAGQDVGSSEMVTALNGHINATERIKRERIGIIGCNGSTDVDDIVGAKDPVINDKGRIVYVGPGLKIKRRDPVSNTETVETLSGAYTAAAFAGKLASLPVQTSPTNKVLNISALAEEFNSGELEKLVQNKILAVEKREGFRVVKGITTSGNSAWSQITTRRIVDKAIYGVRSACNPYIGKLNNDRVRSAMKATIDGFLTRMVEEEALTTYELSVTATRPQEIAGQCMVTMTIQPTFSIDYVVVTIYLG